jgi:hypothetical protein
MQRARHMGNHVTCKLVFTAPAELSRFASTVATLLGYNIGGRTYATYILPHNLSSSPHFLPYS